MNGPTAVATAVVRGFDPLANRDFRRWFLCQILSSSGGATQAVGQAWLVLQLHGGGTELGMVTGALFLPILLLGVPFGSLADRFDRRRVLIVTQSVQLAAASLLTILTWSGLITIPEMTVIALITGLAFAADAPARQVYVFDLVGPSKIASAVGLNEVVINASRILGPALGGALLVLTNVSICFLVNALSFVPTLIVLILMRSARPIEHDPTSAVRGKGNGATLREALWFAASRPSIRTVLLMAVAAGAVYNIPVVMPLMTTKVFGLDAAAYGAVAAAFGLGALPGAIISASAGPIPAARNVRRLVIAMGLAVVACAVAPTVGLFFVCIAVVGGISMWFIARANAYVMLSTPSHLRGRIMGIWSMALPGMNVVSGLLVGGAAEAWGPRLSYGLVGCCALLVAGLGWRAMRPAPVSSDKDAA